MAEELTLQQAAEALGVHYMTAYRYVRLGVLDARKSAGSWRVHRTALEAFHRRAQSEPAAVVPIDLRTPGESGRHRMSWSARLEARLIAGDSRGAWGVIESALAAGTALDAVYLEIIAPAMVGIGTRWENGELDVAIEHRASGIATRLVGQLGPRFTRRGRTRGAVVIGAPPNERHALALSMVADLARLAGWDVSDLGADVPTESFVNAVLTVEGLVAVGVGLAHEEGLASAAAVLEALRQALPRSVALVLGGAAVDGPAQAVAVGADYFAADARAFVGLLDDLSIAASGLPAG